MLHINGALRGKRLKKLDSAARASFGEVAVDLI
jgi:hypothetical protein